MGNKKRSTGAILSDIYPAGAERLVLIEEAKKLGVPVDDIHYSALSNGLDLYIKVHEAKKAKSLFGKAKKLFKSVLHT